MDRLKNSFEQYKNFWILGIAIVIVAALALGTAYMRKHRGNDQVSVDDKVVLQECKPGDAFNIMTGAPCPKETPDVVSASPTSRAETLVRHKGRVLQLTDACVFSPKTQTHRIGTTVMIDNDTDLAQTVGIGTDTYTIGGRHYKTFKLKKDGQYIVDCGGKHSDARIIVTL